MAIYFGTTEITKLRNLAPQTGLDITDLWLGSTNVYTVWQTYEGTLPATINANGDNMKQYQIYGATGGVGEPTENLLDESTLVKGFYDRIDGEIIINPIAKGSIVFRSFRQSLTPGTYTVSFEHNVNIVRAIVDDVISSNVAENISSYTVTTQTGDIGFSMRRTTSSQTPWDNNPTMLTEGTTPPETYVPYGYEVDMATGNNILQSSEIEQGGWQAMAGTVPQKIVNPKRCRSKDMYPISGEKIFYDFKSLNINIAFIDSGGLSLGGSGFKSGVGSVDVPANAVKCFFIIANTDANTNITPAQVIAAGIWASVDATTTPIYIGDDPLDKDEYVDYQAGKAFRRTAQVMPSAPAESKTVNGITVTCDGDGRYSISGTATAYASIRFDIPEFTTPTSVEQGGQGTLSMFNDFANSNVALYFMWGSVSVDDWRLTPANRTNTVYSAIGNKTINAIIIGISAGVTINGAFSPMFTDNGALPETYIPYLQPTDPPVPLPALPTCEGTTIVDYAGGGTAPEKAFLKYRKENF